MPRKLESRAIWTLERESALDWPDLYESFRTLPENELRDSWRAMLADMLTRDPDVRGILTAHTIVHERLVSPHSLSMETHSPA